jgi:hypothetical protein
LDRNAILDQRINKFGCGQKVRLIRGDNVPSRITVNRFAQHLIVFNVHPTPRSWTTGIGCIAGSVCASACCPITLGRRVLSDCGLDFCQRSWANGPVVAAAALDCILPHAIDIEEEVFAMF